MSAIWTPNAFINQNDLTYHTADIRESASVAHIYGQNIVALSLSPLWEFHRRHGHIRLKLKAYRGPRFGSRAKSICYSHFCSSASR